MEELSLRYAKLLIGFVIVMALSTVTIKNHIKTVTKAKKQAEIMLSLEEAAQKQAQNTKRGAVNEKGIRQVVVVDDPVETQSSTYPIYEQNTTQPQYEQNVENSYSAQTQTQENMYEKEGLRKMAEGDLDNAVLYFEKAYEQGDVEAKKSVSKYLVQCYEQKGDITGLINTYNRMLEFTSDPYERRNINEKLADYFIQTGNKEQALKYYEENYIANKSSSDLIKVCDILMELNDKEKMKSYLYERIAQYPQDKQIFQRYIDWIKAENIQ